MSLPCPDHPDGPLAASWRVTDWRPDHTMPADSAGTAPSRSPGALMLWRGSGSETPPPAPGIRHAELLAQEVLVPADLRPHELAKLLHGHRREVGTVVHQALPYLRSRQG